jgi:hypothetical protein
MITKMQEPRGRWDEVQVLFAARRWCRPRWHGEVLAEDLAAAMRWPLQRVQEALWRLEERGCQQVEGFGCGSTIPPSGIDCCLAAC